MRFIRFVAAGTFLALVAAGTSARAGDPPPPSTEVADLRAEVEALKAEVAALRKELAAVHARVAAFEGRTPVPAPTPAPGMGEVPPPPSPSAPRSAAEVLVDTYLAYTDLELVDPARGVTVEKLLEVVADERVEQEVRRRAAEAIASERARTNDPALSMEGRGAARPRARFSLRLLALLVEADPVTRTLAKAIVVGLWGGAATRVPAWDPGDLDACLRASQAWERLFRKT